MSQLKTRPPGPREAASLERLNELRARYENNEELLPYENAEDWNPRPTRDAPARLRKQPAQRTAAQALAPKVSRSATDDLKEIALANIRTDGDVSCRVAIDETTVDEYADALRDDPESLPPVDVFYDGKSYWLADGFLRHAAARRVKLKTIWCQVRQGTRQDAIWFAAGANKAHGLRRTEADKENATVVALKHTRGKSLDDGGIGAHVGVRPAYASKVRVKLFNVREALEPKGDADAGTRNSTSFSRDNQPRAGAANEDFTAIRSLCARLVTVCESLVSLSPECAESMPRGAKAKFLETHRAAEKALAAARLLGF